MRISISNNDYFRFMILTKTRLINLKTGAIIVAYIGQAASALNHPNDAVKVFQQNLLTWRTLASVINQSKSEKTQSLIDASRSICVTKCVFRGKSCFCEQPEARLDKYHDNSVLDAEI